MKIALITGSAGLVGSECCLFFSGRFDLVAGIENDQRKIFFGDSSSIKNTLDFLKIKLPNLLNFEIDIRNKNALEDIFSEYNKDIKLIIHTAAQPSHDWSALMPAIDFEINASGTLNVLESARHYSPNAKIIFVSTNKVYGDHPNRLPLVENPTRWELRDEHFYFKNGIDEQMPIDNCIHSPFGVSKTSADLMVQEYGRYFNLRTVIFRAGCITGPLHQGAQLHGFLAYLTRCILEGKLYTIFGYKGKQVRDIIHVKDLVEAFGKIEENFDGRGDVFNIGGGRSSNCSVLEAIDKLQSITGKKLIYNYVNENRIGDHIWWITNYKKFQDQYPEWKINHKLEDILTELASP
jgi:CDP-paratose 2-epimerase